VAESWYKSPRCHYGANASGTGGWLKVQISGWVGGDYGDGLVVELRGVSPGRQEAAISEVRKDVTRVLEKLAASDLPIPKGSTLAESLQTFLDRISEKIKAPKVNRVTQKGRTLVVHCSGKRVSVDRTAILTCLRDVWGERRFRGRGGEFWGAWNEPELAAYIALLAKESREEARALYVHTHSHHQVFFDKDSVHPCAPLFPKPLWASKHLNTAATHNHIVWRAIPHARKGKLADRVAAITALKNSLEHASKEDRYAEEIKLAVPELCEELALAEEPLLNEAAWLLARAFRNSPLKRSRR
jgi:hypothetical protein